jgi:hypothetical protein
MSTFLRDSCQSRFGNPYFQTKGYFLESYLFFTKIPPVLLTLNFIYCQDFLYFTFFLVFFPVADSVNIKILNAGAWSRSSEKVFVSLPTELEDLIPEVEEFYKKNHSGRKLHWHHLMSNGIVSS